MDEAEVERSAFLASPAPHVISRHRRVLWCNMAFAELFGYLPEELRDKSLASLYPSTDDFSKIGQRGLERMRETPRYNDERMMKHRDGSVFWCRVRGMSLTPDEPFALAVWNFEEIPRRMPDAAGLSPREREIAALVGEGMTSKEVAGRLGLSRRTVEAHRSRVMRKLGVRNVAELIGQILDGPDK